VAAHTVRITGATRFIAHLGYPTTTFRAPMIYNPYFAAEGIDAVVVPMGCRADAFSDTIRSLSKMSNFLGALITMPNKIAAAELAVVVSTAAQVCGSANAIRCDADGQLVADMFDGEGFVRGLRRKRVTVEGASAYVTGAGGVGSAIAASLAQAGVVRLAINDVSAAQKDRLAGRLKDHFPALDVVTGPADLGAFDIVVNATPLGMSADDPMPLAVNDISPDAVVGDVVLSKAVTPLLAAATARGCRTQNGLDMLFEQIPPYLEFFRLPTTTPGRLRELADLPDD
jgi:shikimate dehydrogenase